MDHNRRWKNYIAWLATAILIAAADTRGQEAVKISELPRQTTLTGTNLFLFTQLGNPNTSYTITDADLRTFMNADPKLILPYQFLLYGDVPPQLNNARRLTPGTNVTFSLTTTSLVVNATGGGSGSGLPTPPPGQYVLSAFGGATLYAGMSNFLFANNQWYMPISTNWFQWGTNGLEMKTGINLKIGRWDSNDGTESGNFRSTAEGKNAETFLRQGDTVMDFAYDLTDETTEITTTGHKRTTYTFRPYTLTAVMIGLTTPQTSGSNFTVDILRNEVSIFTTPPYLEAGQKFAISSAFAEDPMQLQLGQKLELVITQVGAGAAGAKVYFQGRR